MAQDPARMQREIEETRAELAGTIDAIAEKVSPKRVARRGGDAAKVKVGEVRVKATEVAGEAKVRAGAVAGQLKGRSLDARRAIEGRVSARRAPGSPDGSGPLAVTGTSGAATVTGSGVSAEEASPDGTGPKGTSGVHRLTSSGLTDRLKALGGDGGPPPEVLGGAGAGLALLVVLLLGRALRRRSSRRSQRSLVDLLPLGD